MTFKDNLKMNKLKSYESYLVFLKMDVIINKLSFIYLYKSLDFSVKLLFPGAKLLQQSYLFFRCLHFEPQSILRNVIYIVIPNINIK